MHSKKNKEGIIFKKKNNKFKETNGYMICYCDNEKYFIFDREDFNKIKNSYWNFSKSNRVYTHMNKKTVLLSRFLLNIPINSKTKVFFKNKDYTDFRKENLYSGSEYYKKDKYYVGITFKNEEFFFDEEDYEIIQKYRWHVDSNGYVIAKKENKSYKMHRVVLGLTVNDKVEVDHINHNKLDNRKNNLRIVTRSQQCMNTRKRKNNSSGIKGVYKMTGYEKWCAQINASGKRIYLGSFNNKEDAINARLEAEKKLHKEYACQ